MPSFPWSGGDIVSAAEMNKMFPIYQVMKWDSSCDYMINGIYHNTWAWFGDSATGSFTLTRFKRMGTILVTMVGDNSTDTFWLNTATYEYFTSGTILGDYLYCWVRRVADGTWHLIRITIEDKTITEMTFSGPAPNSYNFLCSDGTYLYIADGNTTTIRKYSISGTTAIWESNITMPDLVNYPITTNGTYFWFVTSNSGNTRNNTIYRTDMNGNIVNYYLGREFLVDTGALKNLFNWNGWVHGYFSGLRLVSGAYSSQWIQPLQEI